MAAPSHREAWAAAPWTLRLRWLVFLATPWGIVYWRDVRRHRKALDGVAESVVREIPDPGSRYERAVRFLVDRGLDEEQVREGSMPEAALAYVAEVAGERLPAGRPVHVLHVGNFVGVSLCYFSWFAREHHPDSVVVSVDPNITHRGIRDPQSHVFALLHHFGLLDANLLIPGYSLELEVEEWGTQDVESEYLAAVACERVLANLERVCGPRFDLVLLDGNHSEDYLEREFGALKDLLADGSLVVFDDVTEGSWDGVVAVFRRVLEDEQFDEVGSDGRVGILQVRAADRAVAAERG